MSLFLNSRLPIETRKDGITKAPLSEINNGIDVFFIKKHMDGSKEAKFHISLIDILNQVFLNDCNEDLSDERRVFIEKYLKQGDRANKIIDANSLNHTSNDPYVKMDKVFKELDNFLGSFIGEENGRYAR